MGKGADTHAGGDLQLDAVIDKGSSSGFQDVLQQGCCIRKGRSGYQHREFITTQAAHLGAFGRQAAQ